MERRDFLKYIAITGLASSALPSYGSNHKKPGRPLRIAHITDMHIFPGKVPQKGIENLLQEIHSLDDKPDFVINTGDNIMDALRATKEETKLQWQAWEEYFKSKLQYKLYNCIGNHDIWGWGLDGQTVKEDPLYGKNWALNQLGLKSRYYTLDNNGWRFVFLDSSAFAGIEDAYTARLDDEQFLWLEKTLKNTSPKLHVCIVSHIPILSASVFFDGENEKSGDWDVPGAWMHIDARKIKDLLKQYPNVKLAISGHIHLADKTEYLGITYACNGAACGAWWKGNYQEFPPAYAMIDLYDDGSFRTQLIEYNWK